VTRLEDRLRRDLRAQAEHITPMSVPGLRLERFTRDLQAPAGLTPHAPGGAAAGWRCARRPGRRRR